MLILTPAAQAAGLLENHGSQEAWQRATREAVDAQLAGELTKLDHWKAVQNELSRLAPRPDPGDLDVYRAAQLLILVYGEAEAWRQMMEKAASQEGNLLHQAISLRVADAVRALSTGGPEEGRLIS